MVAKTDLTERKLVSGWATGTPGVRIRLAVAGDVPVLEDLVPTAGVKLGDGMAEAIRSGQMGRAYRAALGASGSRYGRESFMRAIAEGLVSGDANNAYSACGLVLAAEHREVGVVGAIVAFPPPHVASMFLDQAGGDPEQDNKVIASVPMALTKISAVAVREDYQRRGIGAALLSRVKKVAFANGIFYAYGQMPSDRPGLPDFYARQGFEVYPLGTPLDVSFIFGMPGYVHADGGERLFVRYRPN